MEKFRYHKQKILFQKRFRFNADISQVPQIKQTEFWYLEVVKFWK